MSADSMHSQGSTERSSSTASMTDSDTSSEPRNFRSLDDVYANTEEVALEDEELFLMGVDEPANYKEAAKEQN